MHKKLKEDLKYFVRKYFGYDLRSLKVKLGEDFLDQKKILENKQVKIVFDIGANVGQTTLKYKKMFPKSQIYGFEPFLDVFKKYTDFYKGDKRVFAVNKAFSNKNGNATFFVNNNSYTNSLLPINTGFMEGFRTVKEISVETETIDSFCKRNNVQYIDILKLDVQGGELLVLEGAKEMLTEEATGLIYTEVEFVEVYKSQPLFGDIQNFLEQYGYKLYKKYIVDNNENGEPIAGDAIFLKL